MQKRLTSYRLLHPSFSIWRIIIDSGPAKQSDVNCAIDAYEMTTNSEILVCLDLYQILNRR